MCGPPGMRVSISTRAEERGRETGLTQISSSGQTISVTSLLQSHGSHPTDEAFKHQEKQGALRWPQKERSSTAWLPQKAEGESLIPAGNTFIQSHLKLTRHHAGSTSMYACVCKLKTHCSDLQKVQLCTVVILSETSHSRTLTCCGEAFLISLLHKSEAGDDV